MCPFNTKEERLAYTPKTVEHIKEKYSSFESGIGAKIVSGEATLEELCEYMSLSEDEVRDIMKMSIDAINKNREYGRLLED